MSTSDPTTITKQPLPLSMTRARALTTAAGLAGGVLVGARPAAALAANSPDNSSGDTAQQIFTAALIAEDLATTFYYNALVGQVIHDPNLAGSGTVKNPAPAPNGNQGNVEYLQAALSEEIAHADLLRTLVGLPDASKDPYQTFYFPASVFTTLGDPSTAGTFIYLLEALESAFIGAYLAAAEEFAAMAADTAAGLMTYKDANGAAYTSQQLEYFAQVAGAIMGVEAEHRVLGRVISNTNPANQLNYESTDGIDTVYNGSNSAVAALTPFLSPGNGATAYSLSTALANAGTVSLSTSGGLPPTGGGGMGGGGGTATPELGSGELLTTGLAAITGAFLYRRYRASRPRQQTGAADE